MSGTIRTRLIAGSLTGLAILTGTIATTTPAQALSTQAAPAHITLAQAVPVHVALTQAVSARVALAQAIPVQAAPAQVALTRAVLAQAAPVQAAAGRAVSAQEPGVVQTATLSADAVLKIADAAMKEAAKQKQRVSVVVVDRSGATRLVLKGDGAGPQTEESARRKAFTAVSFGKATSELGKGLTGTGPSIADIPGTLFLGGGVPVTSGGAPIAGIGVGGAPSGDIDESIAQAALKAITGQLR